MKFKDSNYLINEFDDRSADFDHLNNYNYKIFVIVTSNCKNSSFSKLISIIESAMYITKNIIDVDNIFYSNNTVFYYFKINKNRFLI